MSEMSERVLFCFVLAVERWEEVCKALEEGRHRNYLPMRAEGFQ
jgi:hypothetical protein